MKTVRRSVIAVTVSALFSLGCGHPQCAVWGNGVRPVQQCVEYDSSGSCVRMEVCRVHELPRQPPPGSVPTSPGRTEGAPAPSSPSQPAQP
jgi:hypothetical protein